jgi:hypothetical protein
MDKVVNFPFKGWPILNGLLMGTVFLIILELIF